MRHIGNGNVKPPPFRCGFAVHRIVEIPGILAIYRDQRKFANVNPAVLGFFRHFPRQAGYFLLHFLRPDIGQVMGTDSHFDFHARSQMLAQHLDNPAYRLPTAGGVFKDFHHHNLPVLGVA